MMIEFLKSAARVKPSARQLDWFELEYYAFIHYGVNTFTNREWGDGSEDPQIFNPTKLDCRQWVQTIKTAGMKGLVLTAKHHDGFCLWPSAYTEHSVKNSPCDVDIVKECAEACKEAGIKFGFYLSPWDRNNSLYGTPEYNDYFCNQLTELLTCYGDIFYVWFDNACGEGPNGRKQEYDFPRYINLIRKYQPNAVIFNDYGPDVRWCGNEAGVARHAEWASVPSELCYYSEVQSGPGPMANVGDLSFMYNTSETIGTLNNIMYSKGLTYTPAEINMSIRPGWFWHEHEEPHSLERLWNTYMTSVGANACFHLNIPPTTEGLIDERDIVRLNELKSKLDDEFGVAKEVNIKVVDDKFPTQPSFSIELVDQNAVINYIVLREKIEFGQRIESFQIIAQTENGFQHPLYQGTTIVNKKICQLRDPFTDQNPLTRFIDQGVQRLILQITSARDDVHMKSIEVF